MRDSVPPRVGSTWPYVLWHGHGQSDVLRAGGKIFDTDYAKKQAHLIRDADVARVGEGGGSRKAIDRTEEWTRHIAAAMINLLSSSRSPCCRRCYRSIQAQSAAPRSRCRQTYTTADS